VRQVLVLLAQLAPCLLDLHPDLARVDGVGARAREDRGHSSKESLGHVFFELAPARLLLLI